MKQVLISLYSLPFLDKKEERYSFLKSKKNFVMGEIGKFLDFYLNYFEQYNNFPIYSIFLENFSNIDRITENDLIELNLNKDEFLKISWEWLTDYLHQAEVKHCEFQILNSKDLNDKLKQIDVLKNKLFKTDESYVLLDTEKVSVIPEDLNSKDGILFPIQSLNEEQGSLLKGFGCTVIAPPGSGKTSFGLSMVFRNSFLRDKNSLIFFLEDMPFGYKARLLSRYTYHINKPIPVNSFLYLKNLDKNAREEIENLERKFEEEKKGNIYFQDMNGFSNEPIAFFTRLAKIVDMYNIDFLVFDYLQRMSLFKPSNYKQLDYLNQICSSLFQLALGGFGNRPLSVLILSQTTKEGEKKAEKTKGKISLYDGAEVASIEKDSFIVLSIYTDEALKFSGQFSYQILKSRYGVVNTNPQNSACALEYCFMGDVEALNNVYNNSVITDAWDSFNDL